MPGVLVVVGVEPRYLERDLTGYFTLPDWFWNQRSRHIHIRLVLRFANLTENYQEWLADRDFCVSLVEVLGETPRICLFRRFLVARNTVMQGIPFVLYSMCFLTDLSILNARCRTDKRLSCLMFSNLLTQQRAGCIVLGRRIALMEAW